MDNRLVFDREAMLDRLGGDEEFLVDVLEVFLEETPRMLEATRSAVGSADAEGVERAAHALKGALLNISADSASLVALELERMGRESDLSGSGDTLAQLESEIDRLEQELGAAPAG